MIALDLDRTLLTSDKTITASAEKILKNLHKRGIKVVLCTGRPINAIWGLIQQLGLTGNEDYTITFNGALVVHNNDRKPLFQEGMTKTQLQSVYDFAKQHHTPLDVLDFKQVYEITDLKPSTYKEQFNAGKMSGSIQFLDRSFNQLSDKQSYSKAIISDVAKLLDKDVSDIDDKVAQNYHIARSQPMVLEFLAPKMDKVVGLKALLKHFGWDFSNLMAFGDGQNDLGMVKAAGVGVAMDNAEPEVKKVSKATTLSNDNDGVAVYLERYFS